MKTSRTLAKIAAMTLIFSFASTSVFANKYLPIVPTSPAVNVVTPEVELEAVDGVAVSEVLEAVAPTRSFDISVVGLPINKLIQLVGREASENIILGDDFYLNDKHALPNVSLSYRGDNVEEVLTLLCQAYDFYWKHFENVGYVVTKTRTATFKINRLLDINYSASFNEKAPKTTISGGTALPYLSRVANQLRAMLSPEGKVSVSESGLVTIQDRPSSVRLAQQFLQAEESQKELLQFHVQLIRAEVTTGMAKRIEWSSGRVIHEWQSSGPLGSTIPFVASSAQFLAPAEKSSSSDTKTRNVDSSQVAVFLTPIKVSDDTYRASVYVEIAENLDHPVKYTSLGWTNQHQNSTTSTVLLTKDKTSLITGITFNSLRLQQPSSEVQVEYALLITASDPKITRPLVDTRPCEVAKPVDSAVPDVTAPCNKILYTDPGGVF